MNVPRSLFYLGELNGQLYAIAGWTAVNEDTPTVERYTPSLDSWQRLANFPLDVHEHAGHSQSHYWPAYTWPVLFSSSSSVTLRGAT